MAQDQIQIMKWLMIAPNHLSHFGNVALQLKVTLWAGIRHGMVILVTRQMMMVIKDNGFVVA